MSIDALKKKIKSGSLGGAYLFYGDEEYLKDHYLSLLRRAVERSRDRAALRSVLSESRSWYSYLEIEARRLKEDYFTRLATEAAPVAKKTLRVCYDGVQRLTLQIDNEEACHLVDDPLPELDGRSFSQAVSEAVHSLSGIL